MCDLHRSAAPRSTEPKRADRRCIMGMLDKVTQRIQSLMGHDKSGEGKSDHVKTAVKEAGEQVKDAALHVKDALKGD